MICRRALPDHSADPSASASPPIFSFCVDRIFAAPRSLNYRFGLPSFLGDLSEGLHTRFWSFLASGWVCGWLWEFWNYWAEAKWHYIFPIFQHAKIFEMPVPGYLGFLRVRARMFRDVRDGARRNRKSGGKVKREVKHKMSPPLHGRA